ncbi:hypothetical protein AAE478_003319 [Parahypoxylon ruwenzoriense]
MRRQSRDSTYLRALMGIAMLAGTAAAVCSSWDPENSRMDTPSGFSNIYTQEVDQMVCPADSDEDCHFDRKSYDITAERDLLNDGGLPLDLNDQEELDAIFKLAADVFNKAIPGGNTTEPREFITRKATVNTGSLMANSGILEVEPAINKSLVWTSYYAYSTGILSGCSNETLNNKKVTAAAPYLVRDENEDQNDQTVLAGGWGSVFYNITERDNNKNEGLSLMKRSTSSAISGLLVVITVLAFVL